MSMSECPCMNFFDEQDPDTPKLPARLPCTLFSDRAQTSRIGALGNRGLTCCYAVILSFTYVNIWAANFPPKGALDRANYFFSRIAGHSNDFVARQYSVMDLSNITTSFILRWYPATSNGCWIQFPNRTFRWFCHCSAFFQACFSWHEFNLYRQNCTHLCCVRGCLGWQHIVSANFLFRLRHVIAVNWG